MVGQGSKEGRTQSENMNREQLICVLTGILVLAGMFICVPVSIHMMSLYACLGNPNAGLNEIIVYRFLPEGWPRCINLGLLLCQCVFLTEIVSCLVLVFKKSIKKKPSDIKKSEKILAFIVAGASVLVFFLWVLNSSMDYFFWWLNDDLGLIIIGLLGFLTTVLMIDVFVVNERAILLKMALTSFVSLTVCVTISYSGHKYSPNEIQMTQNLWRLFGVILFLVVWMFYGIYQLIQKRLRTSKNLNP